MCVRKATVVQSIGAVCLIGLRGRVMALRFIKTRAGRLSPLASGICVALAAFTVLSGPAEARHWRHYRHYVKRQAAPTYNPAFAAMRFGYI